MVRQACIVGFVMVVGLGVASNARADTVEVQGARVHMGDLLPDAPEPWASLDMGAAPDLSQELRVTREAIVARLAQARMALPPGVTVPRVLRVIRRGQVVTEPRLTQMVRQELIHALPPGSRIVALRLSGGVALPPGRVKVHVAVPDALTAGAQALQVAVRAEAAYAPGEYLNAGAVDYGETHNADAVTVTAYLELATPARGRRVPVLGRGAEVVVQIRSAGVLVQSSGLAQEAGSIGDIVGVLPTHGSRVLHARVVDATTVEVRL
jgi:hypothetical protein